MLIRRSDEDEVRYVYQQAIHALNGKTVMENVDFYLDVIAGNRNNEAIVGFALHGLVDSVYHADVQGNDSFTFDQLMGYHTYNAPIGHSVKRSEPDFPTPSKIQAATRLLLQAYQTITGISDAKMTKVRRNAYTLVGKAYSYARTGGATDELAERQFIEGAQVYMPYQVAPGMTVPRKDTFAPGYIPPNDSISVPITGASTLRETTAYLHGARPVMPFVLNAVRAAIYIGNRYIQTSNVHQKPLSELRFGLPLPKKIEAAELRISLRNLKLCFFMALGTMLASQSRAGTYQVHENTGVLLRRELIQPAEVVGKDFGWAFQFMSNKGFYCSVFQNPLFEDAPHLLSCRKQILKTDVNCKTLEISLMLESAVERSGRFVSVVDFGPAACLPIRTRMYDPARRMKLQRDTSGKPDAFRVPISKQLSVGEITASVMESGYQCAIRRIGSRSMTMRCVTQEARPSSCGQAEIRFLLSPSSTYSLWESKVAAREVFCD